MSGRDEQEPIHKQDLPREDAPSPDPLDVDFSAEPPAFLFPAIPIAPTRPIDSPANRVLSSGDALIDVARDQLPDGPNPSIFKPRSASARGDRLTDALRPEASTSVEDLLSTESSESDPAFEAPFPITPFAPFIALPHSEIEADATALAHTEEAPGAHEIGLVDAHAAHTQADFAPTDIAPPDLYTPPTEPDIAAPLFHLEPEPESRIPNFGHLLVLAIIAFLGFVAAGLAVQIAFRSHLWGVKTIEQATTDIHYTLASMAVLYVVSFAIAFFLFPLLWDKPFFAGLQWNARAALRHIWLLLAAASFCFVLAMVDELVLPGPSNAPIDKMFSNTAAAWLLFAFGVTVAPFFEEITFRGFLLPALCTAYDWIAEYIASENQLSRPALVVGSAAASSALAVFCEQKYGTHRLAERALLFCFIPLICGLAFFWLYQRCRTVGAGSRVRPLGPNGHPQWSLAAIIAGSVLTSVPFAAMHADQTGYSLGPFVLLFCVSLILCFARISTRSLAASTLVHATYNLILFTLMFFGTNGFKHLDKM